MLAKICFENKCLVFNINTVSGKKLDFFEQKSSPTIIIWDKKK